MKTLLALSLGLVCLTEFSAFASPPGMPARYSYIGNVPGAWRSGAIASAASAAIQHYGYYQPSSLSVNVTSAAPTGPAGGTVGHFNGISTVGATVNVQRGGTTSFSMPTNVANYELGTGTPNTPPGVTVTRSDNGSQTSFTVTAK